MSHMRILTYANPFELKNNSQLWALISQHPHFCASDTLEQGLSSYYGRKEFKTLRTVATLLEIFYKEYTSNPINDMQMYLVVSNAIRQWEDNEIKQAFLFNKADVVKAIQLLLPLECDVDKFDKEALPEEQRRFLDLLQAVKNSSCHEFFDLCREKTLEDYRKAIDEVNIQEIKYCLEKLIGNPKYEIPNYDLRKSLANKESALKTADQVLELLQKKRAESFFYPRTSSAEKDLRVALSLLRDQSDDDYYNTVIFHGIHQITPLMFFLFRHLEKLGVQVIFLINYASNLPRIYQTWKNVYSWCDTKFEFASPINFDDGNALGRSLADVIEGKPGCVLPAKLIEYATMTSFSMNEVGKHYSETLDREHRRGNLAKMSTQYYAVQGRHCNEILRMYYPDQFREKPFLSYPIGQFILGLYQMWDFEEKRLKINSTSLSECVVSGIFHPEEKLLDTIRKTKLFFSDVDSYPDYIARINLLEKAQADIKNSRGMTDWDLLTQVSFLGLRKEELDAFKDYLDQIRDLSEHLFSKMSDHVDYLRHFRDLIDLISNPEYGGTFVSNSERELIQEISSRLATPSTETVIGNAMDVKDALAFFLSGRLDSDSSNWIVRDFMQIDGAVLLSESTRASTYHFALLSNEHMTKSNNNDLPWPLTTDMFGQYCEAAAAVDAVTAGQREKRNFLRYILFYGVFFSRKTIELSYIKEENGESQTPYYLLKAIGTETKPFEDSFDFRFYQPEPPEQQLINPDPLTEEEKELFSVCPFKYLFNKIIRTPIEYSSEYHIKYYLSFALAYVVWVRTHGKGANITEELNHGIRDLKKLFPFWGESVFSDIRNQAYIALNDTSRYREAFPNWVVRRKRNFLVAAWTDQETGEAYSFMRPDAEAQWLKYMTSSQVYPLPSELPPAGICNDCSFSEFCLRELYAAHIDTEEG